MFNSGKMVVTGARNEDDSQLAARRIARVVQVRVACAPLSFTWRCGHSLLWVCVCVRAHRN